MKILIFFAPAFVPLGTALMKELKTRDPKTEVIGLANTRQVRDRLAGLTDISFAALECLEEQEECWITEKRFDARRMKEFEALYGAKTIRDMIVADRQAGAGFVTCAEREDSRLARACRDHNTLDAYMLGLLEYSDNLLETHKPDAVFAYVVAAGPTLALAKACERNGIFFARMQHTRMDDRTVIDTDLKGMMAPIWQRFSAGEKPAPALLKEAAVWLKNFREKNSQPDYMALLKTQSRKALSVKGIVLSIGKALARAVLYDFIKPNKPLRAPSGWQGVRQSITTPLKTIALQKRRDFKGIEDLKTAEFIYYPLHVDPEASTMVLAPDYTNQVTVIEGIAKSMPPSMRLFVKEHPNMAGRRPKGFYAAITALPGVSLMDPAITGRDALALCKLAVTITGTAGWEAALLGKPCVVLGDAHFQQFESIEHCPAITDLPEAIEKAFTKKPLSHAELERFLGITFEESFGLPSALAWASEHKTVSEVEWPIVRNMTDHLLRRYEQGGKKRRSKAA